MTYSFLELTDRLTAMHFSREHLLDPDFDPAIDDLEREFSELRCSIQP